MAYTERYVRDDTTAGGNGTTDANSGANRAWTFSEAVTSATSGMRINVKKGTYTLGANVTLPNGATENPILWQGFQATAGDLEGVGRATPTAELTTTDFPLISGVTFNVTLGTFNSLRNLRIESGTTSSVIAAASSAPSNIWRCSIKNTAASGSSAGCVAAGTSYAAIIDNDFAISTSSAAAIVDLARGCIIGCRLWNTGTPSGASLGIANAAISGAISGNVIFNIGIAISIDASVSSVHSNTWYNVVTGLRINGSASACVFNNVGWLHTGWALIGSASSGNTLIYNNALGSHTSGRLDTSTLGSVIEEVNPIALGAIPFTNAGSADFTLNNNSPGGAQCRAVSTIFGGYGDLGAVQVQPSSGGGGFWVSRTANLLR
jgi:hypothetical protein